MSDLTQQMALVGTFALLALYLGSPTVAGLAVVVFTLGKLAGSLCDF